jgi:hypothetical protein
VWNRSGNPMIDCGAGDDTVIVRTSPDVRRCEQIE